MSDMIHYNYQANYAGLEDIQSASNDAEAMRIEIDGLFAALQSVYDGQTATELQVQKGQILQQMESVLAEIGQTRQGGNQSQEDAAALDAHLAGGF
jgi:uncharacterized protein YukE